MQMKTKTRHLNKSLKSILCIKCYKDIQKSLKNTLLKKELNQNKIIFFWAWINMRE